MNKQSTKLQVDPHQTASFMSYLAILIFMLGYFVSGKLNTFQKSTSLTSSKILDNLTENLSDPNIRHVDSVSYFSGSQEIYSVLTGDFLLDFFSSQEAVHAFIKPSLAYVQNYMKQNNINTLEDILSFSKQIQLSHNTQKTQDPNNSILKTPLHTLVKHQGEINDITLLIYTMASLAQRDAKLIAYKSFGTGDQENESQVLTYLLLPVQISHSFNNGVYYDYVCLSADSVLEQNTSDLSTFSRKNDGQGLSTREIVHYSNSSENINDLGTRYSLFDPKSGKNGYENVAQYKIKAIIDNDNLQ